MTERIRTKNICEVFAIGNRNIVRFASAPFIKDLLLVQPLMDAKH